MRACIAIPVRNEEDLLPDALHALAEQRRLDGHPFPHSEYELLLLINNTVDRSAQVAGHFGRLYPSLRLHIVERNLSPANAHIGYVRRLLMDEAFRRTRAAQAGEALMLSTDADTQVASNWIAQNLAEMRAGAEVVGGRIIVAGDERASLDTVTRSLLTLDALYRRLVSWIESQLDPDPHDPWPRHHHHFGASLAITPDAYEKVGGVPPRRHLEDVAFYAALLRCDIRIRHSMKVRVATSARLAGRTRYGLSKTLSDWRQSGRRGFRLPVESRAFLEFLFDTRHRLRRVWLKGNLSRQPSLEEVSTLAASMGCACGTLRNEIRAARRFGTLLENVRFYRQCRAAWPEWKRLDELQSVVDDLLAAFRSVHGRSPLVFESALQRASTNGHSASTQLATGLNPLTHA
jgi:GT2 family glycosyltransferase